MNGFSNHQLKKLVAKLDRAHVHSRAVDGKKLDYIGGWFAIAEANRIFGFAGWDREMVQCERVFERNRADGTACGYLARVRVTVRAGQTTILREGTGFGQASAKSIADAHERALKTAETDATKRALATFGNRFGLALYDKDRNGVTAPAESSSTTNSSGNSYHSNDDAKYNHTSAHHHSVPLKLSYALEHLNSATASPNNLAGEAGRRNIFNLTAPDGEIIASKLSPEGFCTGLRQLIDASVSPETLQALQAANRDAIILLRHAAPGLKSRKGDHFADILERMIAKRLASPIDPPAASAIMTQSKTAQSAKSEDANTDLEANKVSSAQSDTPQFTKPSRLAAGLAIDKSLLAISGERRVRSKAHLRTVAAKPCLICEEQPCHAHHITFAQPRGLSIKVSDEFTVPLCAVHHNELHATSHEQAFWRKHGLNPLSAAAALWLETQRLGSGSAEKVKGPDAAQ